MRIAQNEIPPYHKAREDINQTSSWLKPSLDLTLRTGDESVRIDLSDFGCPAIYLPRFLEGDYGRDRPDAYQECQSK